MSAVNSKIWIRLLISFPHRVRRHSCTNPSFSSAYNPESYPLKKVLPLYLLKMAPVYRRKKEQHIVDATEGQVSKYLVYLHRNYGGREREKETSARSTVVWVKEGAKTRL